MLTALLPTKKQWATWSKPTKYQFVGLVVAFVALFPLDNVLGLLSTRSELSYNEGRTYYIKKLEDSSTCLAARLYFDGLHPLETDCQLDIAGLADFARRYAPYLATTPYSGAWNLEKYSKSVEASARLINSTSNQRELAGVQQRHDVSVSEAGYYLCGIEWYLRASPPNKVGEMLEERVKTYQTSWLSWQEQTGDRIKYAPFDQSRHEVKDDPQCASFVDLLD